MSFRCSICALALCAGCRGRSSDQTAAPPAIEISAYGTVTTRIVAGHPCRASVEGVEMIVGGRPLVSQLAGTRWTGDDGANGTTLRSDGAAIARLYPTADATQLAVFDPAGVPMIRVATEGSGASVSDHQSVVVRRVDATPTGFAVRAMDAAAPIATAAGTTDAILVGFVSSPELTREVRALAACSRLLPAELD